MKYKIVMPIKYFGLPN